MYMLITIVSYYSVLLLTMSPSMTNIIQTMLLSVPGLALIIWKKPWQKIAPISKSSWLGAVIVTSYFGLRFYNRWIISSKVRAIAAMLHFSNHMLVFLAAAGIGLCSVYCMAGILQYTKDTLRTKDTSFSHSIRFCLAAAFTAVILSQLMIGTDILSMGIIKFIWGTVIVSIVCLSMYCISGKTQLSAALGTGLFIFISSVNVYVHNFRGRMFEPIDIFSAGTALNVADNYNLFPPPCSIVIGWVIWSIFFIYALRKDTGAKYRITGKQRIILALCCLAGAASVFGYTANLKTYHWDKEGAVYNGFILDFTAKIKETYVAEPNGYSEAYIAELSVQYPQNEDAAESQKKPPHMIVIMDEAFSDLNAVGEISTEKEVMPFISSLKENTISGYALASVYGGNTANSEYEFLTGNSMAWLSPNVVPYQQYMRSPAYSMVSYLKTHYNYRCVAMHPYYSDGWNRPAAYTHLGFDEMFFLEGFPQKHLIRQFVSDREMFETIVDTYERRNDQPLFLFGVSMQNHGGYTYSGENYAQSISLVGYDKAYADVEQYLSLIHETDRAVEYLISYFEKVEDEVVIVFFGDHQPKINAAFYDVISNDSDGSLDAQQNKYKVPFFVWANYDIDEQYVECTSLNYLSSYVYEAAGLPLPPYNQFLSELQKKIPAINANGFYSLKDQCYLFFEQASEEEQSWLQTYNQLQYNSLFDQNHRNNHFFPVPE